jgi:hypothetical protein
MGWLLNFECAHSVVVTLEVEMTVVRALDLAVVWRIVDKCGWVRRLSFRSQHKVSQVVLCSGHYWRRCLGVWGGCSRQVQLRDR